MVAAIAGPQFSVVSGGVLCLAGLVAVLRLFPQLLSWEVGRGERPDAEPGQAEPGEPPDPTELDRGAASGPASTLPER